jgi:tetratricopeptide (TPR) repeat protein
MVAITFCSSFQFAYFWNIGNSRYSEAIKYLDKALVINPDYVRALTAKGAALDQLENDSACTVPEFIGAQERYHTISHGFLGFCEEFGRRIYT